MLVTLGKIALAGVVLGAICFLSQRYLMGAPTRASQWKLIVEMAGTIGVGAVAFFGMAYLLRVAEVEDVVKLARRKLKI